MIFSLPATVPQFLLKLCKNRSYNNNWDTGFLWMMSLIYIFKVSWYDLFLLLVAMPPFWWKWLFLNCLEDSWDISKIVKRYPYYDLHLWYQGQPSNIHLIANYFFKHMVKDWRKLVVECISARDIRCFHFFPCNPFSTWFSFAATPSRDTFL